MNQTHVLKYDGYHTSAERLLENVMFEVDILEEDGNLVITGVRPPARDAEYLKSINLPPFLAEIHESVQENIEYLRNEASRESKTVSDLLDEFQADPSFAGLQRIDLLSEV